jgi:hypothetical protein
MTHLTAKAIERYGAELYLKLAITHHISALTLGRSKRLTEDDIAGITKRESDLMFVLYELTFLTWDYLKPLAIKKKLIACNYRHRDYFYKMMSHELSMFKRDISTLRKVRSLYDNIGKTHNTTLKILSGDSLNRAENNRLHRSFSKYKKKESLYFLLIETASKVSDKDSRVLQALLNYIKMQNDRLYIYAPLFHWENVQKIIK